MTTYPGSTSRTVIHVSQPGDGGVGAYVRDLVSDQLARGWRVCVACPERSELHVMAAAAGAKVLPWHAVRSPGPSVVSETTRLSRVISAVRPDVVHLHSSKAGLAGRLALRKRTPTVFHPHGWSFGAVDGVLRTAALSWERFGARWAHAIVCVSEEERSRGIAAGIRAKWRVIQNGVDLTAFPMADERDRAHARQALGLEERPIVVCVGRLAPEKGQDVLLDAWPLVLGRVPAAQLALVGDGPDRPELERRNVASVIYAGQRDDVTSWLAAADVVVLPSRSEGMALTMLEAMASGRSVVATDVPGAREAIGDTSDAIVPREDPPALAEALGRRLLDPRIPAAEGAEGRARAERSHDVRRTAAAVAELYGELTRR